MNIAKQSFYKRVLRFFNERNIAVCPEKDTLLFAFLHDQFQAQNRGQRSRFVITPKFVTHALAKLLNTSQPIAVRLLAFRENNRSQASYTSMLPQLQATAPRKSGGSIIARLGRRHEPTFKLTQPNGDELTPQRLKRAQKLRPKFNVSFSPLKPLSEKGVGPRALARNGALYERELLCDKWALSREISPSAPRRIQFKKLSDLNLKRRLTFIKERRPREAFTFTISKHEVHQRINEKRPISQRQVMGNISAHEVMIACGAIMDIKLNGRSCHWAHRRAFSLGGEQEEGNLDSMTAGANYNTLFKVESPIIKMLLSDQVEKIEVRGEVHFNQKNGLPSQIIYRFSDVLDPGHYIEVHIDPMNPRIPTITEHNIVYEMLGDYFSFPTI